MGHPPSGEQSEHCSSVFGDLFRRVSSVSGLFQQSSGIGCIMLPTSLPVFLLLGLASLIDARFLLFSSQPSKCDSTAHCTPLSRCPGMSALVKDSTRHRGINLLRRSSCGFARTEPMVCCSSQSKVEEEEKVEARVVNVIQSAGGNNNNNNKNNKRAGGSFSGRVDDSNVSSFGGLPSDNVAERTSDKGSSAVRFGGSEEVAQVETGRRAEEEEFSRRNGFGPEVSVEDSGEDWGGEDEDGDEDDEWRQVAGGDSWDLGGGGDVDESYEGEDWGWRVLEPSVSLPLTVFRLFISFVCLTCTPVFLSPCMKMRESDNCWAAR